MDFQIWDFPGHLDYFEPSHGIDTSSLLDSVGALIWVIDAQDEYRSTISSLIRTVLNLRPQHPAMNIEVFVHKIDGLSDEYKTDTFLDIMHRVQDELADNGFENIDTAVGFYQTSIYDHTIFEAFSKVIQKLMPAVLPTLETLLDGLVKACSMDKAFLFDTVSKIYIAADTSPSDSHQYQLCSDFIDFCVDMQTIFAPRRVRGSPPSSSGEEDDADERRGEAAMDIKGNCDYIRFKEMDRHLALLALMSGDARQEDKAQVDYNVAIFQHAMKQVLRSIRSSELTDS